MTPHAANHGDSLSATGLQGFCIGEALMRGYDLPAVKYMLMAYKQISLNRWVGSQEKITKAKLEESLI